ncbi:hypothetical protein K3495_g8425 [Podosphaera aphanis]|nr:hypothetical protein K3495_g8425 [Podosphaera aphanis]
MENKLASESRRNHKDRAQKLRRAHLQKCPKKSIGKWIKLEWQRRWSRYKGKRSAETWKTPWHRKTLKLYEGLKKHEATAVMLLRTEVIGLNSWLASIRVPGISPRCTCGEWAQTVKHILCYCGEHSALRSEMFRRAGTSSFQRLLQTPRGCHAAARMLISTGRLQQFAVADKIEHEVPDLIKTPSLD